MQVADLMIKGVVTVSPEDFPKDAFEKLKSGKFHHLVVVDAEKRIVGMLSAWDFRPIINYMASAGELKNTQLGSVQLYNVGRVKDLMTPNPISVSPQMSVSDLAQLMLERNIHGLPVTDNGELVGIITHRDVLRAVANKKLT